jgi:CRP-like cAMP-binding protein/Zn-dependent protease
VTTPLDFGPFLALDEPVRARLLAEAERVSFAPRQAIVREGERADAVFAVVAGRVRVAQGDPAIVVAVPGAPVLVGEMAVLGGTRRNATVSAVTHVRAYRIAAEGFLAVAAAHDPFARELASFAAIRVGDSFLRRSSPFADLPAASIEALAAKLVAVEFAPGTAILREGEGGDDVYLLRSGDVEVTRAGRLLATLGAGAFVGEVSALTGTARSATVSARTPVGAFRLRAQDVRPIVRKHQELIGRLEGTMQSRHIPHRASEVIVAPAPDDANAVLLREAGGSTYLRVTKEALAIYDDIDGERTLRDLAVRHFERTGALDPAGVFGTVATFQAAGLVTAPRVASDEPDARVLRVLDLLLAPRLELKSADGVASALHRAVGWAFTRAGAAFGTIVGAVGLAALLAVFRQSSPGDFGLGGLAVAFLGLLLAGIGHEAAHAVAAKAEGRRVGKAGIGLLWFTPVVYVDTSDAWLLPRARRIRVNAAGPLFNFAFAGLCGLAGLILSGRAQDVAVWLAILNLVSVAFNLSPLLEFDGYYVLEDLTNTNALRRKALRFVFSDLVARPRRLDSREEAGLVAYTAAAFAYVLVMSLVVLSGVPKVVDGTFAGRIGPEFLPIVGVALALVLAALLVGPFVGEVLAARSAPAD